ncbi:hypothetical protein BOX15_Mlig017321g1 [Macrostomum lignano]|uniref:Uncharacterized protein n=2 Tax=Macrostomum lignano TaxID=282301 RepID=A0A267FE08_9PLAT|nr:hypothetical protein BOX15_Mlig021852g2 [Macrostomum lignano]PAA51578.1 hypothetical protein BOX15_Mlig021852g1 [Macrostomum lignano]PAA71988.1 hypothetical protein BOX15_Mlig017321g1 [Macrostomum lignano]
MSCNAFISWEIQDNIKLRSIISQSVISLPEKSDEDLSSDTPQTGNQTESILQQSQPPKRYISLCPFEHPELTNPSRDACELRLHCDAHHNLSIRSVRLVATARNVEVYDRRGDYICTVQGAPMAAGAAANWHVFECNLPDPNYEVKFKFLSLAGPGSLKLACVSIQLEQHNWPAHPSDRALSVTSLLERLSEVELSSQARSLLNLVTAASGGVGGGVSRSVSTSQASIQGLRQWLDCRLDTMEKRINERLDRIEARIDDLSSRGAEFNSAK